MPKQSKTLHLDPQASASWMSLLLSSITDGVCVISQDLRIVFMNETFAQIFGISEEKLIGKNISKIVSLLESSKESMKTEADVMTLIGMYDLSTRAKSMIIELDVVPIPHINQMALVVHNVTERIHIEEALIHSQADLQTYVDSMSTFNAKLDLDATILMVNRTASDAIGLEKIKIIGTNFLEGPWWGNNPAAMKRVRKAFRQAKLGKAIQYSETVYIRDNQPLTIDFSLKPVRGYKNTVSYIIAEGRDITQLTQAQQKLREREESLREAQNLAHIGSWEWEVAEDVITWSNELYTIYEVDPEQAPRYEDIKSFVHPEDREMFNKNIQRSLKNRKPFSVYHRIITKSGTIKAIHGQGRCILDKQGRVLKMIGTAQDITKEKEQQDMLKLHMADLENSARVIEQENAKNEAIISSIGEGIIATNDKRRIVLVNEAAESLLGWSSEELIGKDYTTAILCVTEKGLQVPIESRPFERAYRTKTKTFDDNLFYICKDGSRFPAAVTASPIMSNNKVVGSIMVFRDITQEKRIDKAKSEFVSLASHELRTPLSYINWYCEKLLSEDSGQINDNQKRYLEEIYHGNQRMVAMVNDLLSISRMELGTFLVDLKPCDFCEIAQEVLDEMEPQISKKHLAIEKQWQCDIFPITADPKLIKIIFQNLISNAVKYTPDQGRITITIRPEKTTIYISVADTGYGIPKYQLPQLFNKLFRGDNVRELGTEGTGLGLYIVKSILTQVGGTIRFDSTENQGTTFYVTYPRS